MWRRPAVTILMLISAMILTLPLRAQQKPVASRFSPARAYVAALVPVGFPFDDEPTVNSQDELAVATSGSHSLRRGSNG